jgi:hypothetical protein
MAVMASANHSARTEVPSSTVIFNIRGSDTRIRFRSKQINPSRATPEPLGWPNRATPEPNRVRGMSFRTSR